MSGHTAALEQYKKKTAWMLKASSGAQDERGEDRGKSSAAHARAPPIDPCDRQTATHMKLTAILTT